VLTLTDVTYRSDKCLMTRVRGSNLHYNHECIGVGWTQYQDVTAAVSSLSSLQSVSQLATR